MQVQAPQLQAFPCLQNVEADNCKDMKTGGSIEHGVGTWELLWASQVLILSSNIFWLTKIKLYFNTTCCIVCHQQKKHNNWNNLQHKKLAKLFFKCFNIKSYLVPHGHYHQNFILIFLSFIVINKMAFFTNQLKISAQALWLRFYSFSMKPRFNQDFNVFRPWYNKNNVEKKNVNIFS